MIVRPAERGFSVTFDARLVPSSSDVLYASGCLLFVLALVFGGGTKQGLWSDALIEIAALPVLALAVWNLRLGEFDTVARGGLLLALLILLVPLLELIPLPPWLWHVLPGRMQITQELSLVGLGQTWQPITLAPRECLMALLALLPAVACFVLTIQLDASRRCTLVLIFLTWVYGGVVLSVMQMFSGPDGSLRFYAGTNLDRAVGFFANANHNALALSLAIPFLMLSPFAEVPKRVTSTRFFLTASIVIFVVVAISLTRSRAGVGFVLLAILLSSSVVLLRTKQDGSRKRYFMIALCLAVLAAFAAFQTGFVAILNRFEAPLAGDLRWGLLHVSYSAVLQFLPIGSGLGSFVPIYERFAPLTLVHQAYVNHAHDDWIELLVELGMFWPIMVIVFVVWAGFAIRHLWRKYGMAALDRISLCLIALLLFGIASAMDYPLRTIALMSLFGAICGFLIGAPDEARAKGASELLCVS